MRSLARFGLGLLGLAFVAYPLCAEMTAPHRLWIPPQLRRRPRRPNIIIRASSGGGIARNASGPWPRNVTEWTFPLRPQLFRLRSWPDRPSTIMAMGKRAQRVRRALLLPAR